MKYFATLNGEDIGEIRFGDIDPKDGAKVRLRHHGELVNAFIHTRIWQPAKNAALIHFVRPETWMKGNDALPVSPIEEAK
jgi:hypothetical protein